MAMQLDAITEIPRSHFDGSSGEDFRRIEKALAFVAENFRRQPSLNEIADHVGVSEFHFQRQFTRWAGISPKRFLQYLTLQSAQESLSRSATVLDAALDAGLSGPGRLHDLFVTYAAVTPGEFRERGAGVAVRYGFAESPFGECVLMLSDRGITGLGFVADGAREAAFADLARGWDRAAFVADNAAVAPVVRRIFEPARGDRLHLLLRGTEFQLRVWEALLRIPPGHVASYDWLARAAGSNGRQTARAIGQANAANAIAYLIPCHRVIQASGYVGGYRWGQGRKLAILGREAAEAESSA